MDKKIDFSELILGFSSSALYAMGEAGVVPPNGTREENLSLARQNIDILDLLQEKTKNNLTPDEDELLGNVIKDLKLKFIEKS